MATNNKRIATNRPRATKIIAKILAEEVLKTKPNKSAILIALKGELGAGKTTFIQGFVRACGIRRRITSPTFLIIKKFKIQNSKFKILFHIDAYRLKKPRELLALGFNEIIADPQNIVLIEWADKIRKIIPRNAIWLELRHEKKEKKRTIIMK